MSATEALVMRYVIALIWLATAAVSLGLYPLESSLTLLDTVGLHGKTGLPALYTGAVLDAFLGLATLFFPGRHLWRMQGAVIAIYTLILTIALPEFWLHPFGPLLKNGALLALLWLLIRHEKIST